MTVSDFAAKNPTRSDDSEVSTKFWLKGFVLSVDVLLGSVVVFFLLANLIKRKTRSVETLRRLDSNWDLLLEKENVFLSLERSFCPFSNFFFFRREKRIRVELTENEKSDEKLFFATVNICPLWNRLQPLSTSVYKPVKMADLYYPSVLAALTWCVPFDFILFLRESKTSKTQSVHFLSSCSQGFFSTK